MRQKWISRHVLCYLWFSFKVLVTFIFNNNMTKRSEWSEQIRNLVTFDNFDENIDENVDNKLSILVLKARIPEITGQNRIKQPLRLTANSKGLGCHKKTLYILEKGWIGQTRSCPHPPIAQVSRSWLCWLKKEVFPLRIKSLRV